MRKFLIAIAFLSMCLISEAQKLSLPKVDTLTTVKDYEMEVIRECLWKYQKQHQVSYLLTAAGTAFFIMGATTGDKPDHGLIGVGGGLMLVSLINFVAADKWLKIAGVRPTASGIAIRIPSKKK